MATATATALNPFKKVTRAKTRLRLALDGPAGSGKSYTALRFAHALAHCIREDEGREATIAAIDTENGSLAKYAGETEDGIVWDWSGIDLQDFSPTSYTQLIKIAEQNGFDILIIDSLSHAWQGSGGALDLVDKKKNASRSGNAFTDGWRDVTPMHNAMVDAIVRSSCHIIATMRTKTEWVMETDSRGKVVPRKIGMAPVQRAGMEYEFDIVGDIDQETHTLTISKTRFKGIDNAQIVKPGLNFFVPIWHWLNSGSNVPRETLEAAAFKTKEEPMSVLERAKRQAAARKAVTPKGPSVGNGEAATTAPETTPTPTAETTGTTAPPDASSGNANATVQMITEATRAELRQLISEIWIDRERMIAESKKLLDKYGVELSSELTESNAQSLKADLLQIKSAELQRRAAEQLAASGTSVTVDVEPNATKPAPATAAAAATTTQATTAAEAETPQPTAADSPEGADLSDAAGTVTQEQLKAIQELSEVLGWKYDKQKLWLEGQKCQSFRNLSEKVADDLIGKLEAKRNASLQTA